MCFYVLISSVKWGHLAHLDPTPTNTISPTNPMGPSSTILSTNRMGSSSTL